MGGRSPFLVQPRRYSRSPDSQEDTEREDTESIGGATAQLTEPPFSAPTPPPAATPAPPARGEHTAVTASNA